MANVFLGCDPGYTGFLVLIDEQGKYLLHYKIPILSETKHVKKRVGKRAGQIVSKTKRFLDETSILTFLNTVKCGYTTVFACVEKQHAMTGQGLASTAKNMYGYGFWVGICKGLGFQTYSVGAVEWQKVTSDPKAEDKKAASVLSVHNWNKDIDLKKTKRSRIDDHNLADAVNISRFCWHKFGPNGESHVEEK